MFFDLNTNGDDSHAFETDVSMFRVHSGCRRGRLGIFRRVEGRLVLPGQCLLSGWRLLRLSRLLPRRGLLPGGRLLHRGRGENRQGRRLLRFRRELLCSGFDLLPEGQQEGDSRLLPDQHLLPEQRLLPEVTG